MRRRPSSAQANVAGCYGRAVLIEMNGRPRSYWRRHVHSVAIIYSSKFYIKWSILSLQYGEYTFCPSLSKSDLVAGFLNHFIQADAVLQNWRCLPYLWYRVEWLYRSVLKLNKIVQVFGNAVLFSLIKLYEYYEPFNHCIKKILINDRQYLPQYEKNVLKLQ